MTPAELKTLIDAATPGPCEVSSNGHMIYVRALNYRLMWNGNNVQSRTQQARNEIALAATARNLLPSLVRLWEAAEKMEPMLSAADEDELGIEHLMNEIRSTLDELRDTKGTQ